MDVNTIRNLDMYDFEIHSQLAILFEAAAQGALLEPIKKKAPSANEVLTGRKKGGGALTQIRQQRFDPNIGDFVDI